MPRLRAWACAIGCLLLAGCGTPVTWGRAGAGDETMRADLAECRAVARLETFRRYAWDSGFPTVEPRRWGYSSRPDWFLWHQRTEADRAFHERRLADLCMRNKGYERVPAAEAAPAPASPAPPASSR